MLLSVLTESDRCPYVGSAVLCVGRWLEARCYLLRGLAASGLLSVSGKRVCFVPWGCLFLAAPKIILGHIKYLDTNKKH